MTVTITDSVSITDSVLLLLPYLLLAGLAIALKRAWRNSERQKKEATQKWRKATEMWFRDVAAYMHHLTAHCDKMCYNDLLYKELDRLTFIVDATESSDYAAFFDAIESGEYKTAFSQHFDKLRIVTRNWISDLTDNARQKLEILKITHEIRSGNGSTYPALARRLKKITDDHGRVFPAEMYPTDAEMKLCAKRWAIFQLDKAATSGADKLAEVFEEIQEEIEGTCPDLAEHIESLVDEAQQQILAMPDKVGTEQVTPAPESENGQKQEQ